jgi:histone deacetylase complex regulatory component SIN3
MYFAIYPVKPIYLTFLKNLTLYSDDFLLSNKLVEHTAFNWKLGVALEQKLVIVAVPERTS